MIKLLLFILCLVALAAAMLQLRQQRLNLSFQTNRLHNEIQATQAELWNQQLRIAECTAPNAIEKTVGHQNLKFVTPTPKAATSAADQSANAE